jgi:hypothetical protein
MIVLIGRDNWSKGIITPFTPAVDVMEAMVKPKLGED